MATALEDEWQGVGDACEGGLAPSSEILDGTCQQSPAAATADQTVVVIGDSHAQQLGTPMALYAAERGIGVVTLLKGGCTIGATEGDRGPANPYTCEEWLPAAVDYTVALRPTAVYVIATRADAVEPERLLDGVEETIETFLDAGIAVIAVRDNPRFPFDMYSCVEAGEQCAVPQDQVLARDNPAAALDGRVVLVDYTPWLCPEGVCGGAIGNIAVYIDDNHVSRSYARTLAPMLDRMLRSHGVFS